MSLPYILMYALAPKDGQSMILALTGAALAGVGVYGLIKMRTWGVLSLVGSAATLLISLPVSPDWTRFGADYVNVSSVGLMAVALLAIAVAPFARPIVRYLRQPLQ
jgi:hypothetical protein